MDTKAINYYDYLVARFFCATFSTINTILFRLIFFPVVQLNCWMYEFDFDFELLIMYRIYDDLLMDVKEMAKIENESRPSREKSSTQSQM